MRKLRILIAGALIAVGVFALSPATTHATNVDNGTTSVKTIQGESLSNLVTTRAKNSWPWYIVRASGLVAGVTLIILILSGIGSVTGHTFRFLEPLTAWATHRALGIVFVVTTIIHMVGLLFDHFVSFDLLSILVPWVSDYKPVTLFGLQLGSLYVAFGVLAFYGALAILLTSLFWVDKKPKVWKALHISSYVVIAFVFLHGLFLGTDTATGIIRLLWVLGGILVVLAALARLRRVGTTHDP